jgi:hypothetical protein
MKEEKHIEVSEQIPTDSEEGTLVAKSPDGFKIPVSVDGFGYRVFRF